MAERVEVPAWVVVSAFVVRRGKGGKTRIAWMDDFGWEHVAIWLERRGELTAPDRGWLFCTIAQPSPGGRLGAPQVRTMLKRKGAQAGITRRLNPHSFRHGFAFGMAREGVPVTVISKALGHSNIGTTHTYLNHVDPSMMVDAVTARPRPGAARERDEQAWEKQARDTGPEHISPPTTEVEG